MNLLPCGGRICIEMADERTGRVVGRAAELAEADAFLERASNGFAALFLAGESGLGKTALWQAIVERARPRMILLHRASEAEATLSFTALADLLGDIEGLGQRPDANHATKPIAALAAPRRRAIEAALLLRDPDPGSVDPRRLGLAVLDLLRIVSRTQPVLLAIDDLQWLDGASAETLRFVLRRLRNEPIGVVATLRSTADRASVIDLAQALPEGRVQHVRLAPLSSAELHLLLRMRLDLDLSRPQLVRLHDLSGGNPFFALEIGAELIRTGATLDPSHTPPLPRNLEVALWARLERLSPLSMRLLQVAAATARPEISTVAAFVQTDGEAETGLDEAIHEGVLEVDGQRLAFTHPLLASICYRRIPPLKRRRLHRRLAELTQEPEETARHLALSTSGPDAAIAAGLGRAAEHAAGRGATAAAADLAEMAARLTPADRVADGRGHRLRAAELLHLSGDLDRSAAILRRLAAESPSGPERADALFALARTRRTDLEETIGLCEEALRQSDDDSGRQADILSYLSWVHQIEGRIPQALARARAAVERAEQVGDPVLMTRTLARAAMEELWAMEHTPGLLERGVALERSLQQPLAYYDRPSLTLARRLALTGEYDSARAIYEAADREAHERGEDVARGRILFHLALVEWYDGQPVRALAIVADALELADQLHDDQYRSMTLHAGSFIDAHLGLVDRAREAATEGLRLADGVGDSLFNLAHRNVLGFIDLSLGDVPAAAQRLASLPDVAISRVWVEPAFNPIWPNAIEALVLLGDIAAAKRHLAELERRATVSVSEWSRAVAARCRGLVEAADGDLIAADVAFEQAAAAHERIRAPFDRARTLLAWGALLRRRKQKRQARAVLEEAQREFATIGARIWIVRTVTELARVGGRRPSGQVLTPTEERVARLAAAGLSNKEIAAAVGSSVTTVETHLTRVYAKLEVRSRVQLGRLLAAGHRGGEAAAPGTLIH